jgi:hypothetical protein
MTNCHTFTILSPKAPLIEVTGEGPIRDTPGGMVVPDGAATTVRIDLQRTSSVRWRVDASTTERTAIVVTDSPYGAFVSVRRYTVPKPVPTWWRPLAADQWPVVRGVLRRQPPPRWRCGISSPTSFRSRARGGPSTMEAAIRRKHVEAI